jgi:dCTP deaminase
MSILLREDLFAALQRSDAQHRLVVTPLLDNNQIGPGSIDLRLGTQFIEVKRYAESVIDPFRQPRPDLTSQSEDSVFVPLGSSIVLHPGQLILGSTLEFIRLPKDIAGQVVSRSSWGRLGLIVATAVAVQPGFGGCLTLELVNTGNVPIRLYPGLRVAQLQLWSAAKPTESPYLSVSAKYRAPLGPQSNRLAWETDELDRISRVGSHLLGAGPRNDPPK